MTEHESAETEESRDQPSRGALVSAAAARASSSASWPTACASLAFERKLRVQRDVAAARVGYAAGIMNAALGALDGSVYHDDVLDAMLEASDYDALLNRLGGFQFELDNPVWAAQFADVEVGL